MPVEVAPDLVISHYRIVGALGAGGMGEVYAAVDETLRRRVALKAVRRDRLLDPETKARFLREARILSQLDHPQICRVYDYIEVDGREWLVLELIEGQTLHEFIRRHPRADEKLRIARQVADVLVATHAAGVVHRDLKPGNVMITRAGDVKVLDFGLSATMPQGVPSLEPIEEIEPNGSKAIDGVGNIHLGETRLPTAGELARRAPGIDVSGVHSTLGTVMGTIGYMSPEQARGEAATSASDIYSFGLVLQELYTARAPYPEASDAADALIRAQHGETAPLSGIAGDMRSLIQRLTSPIAAQRPTALDVSERLRWIHDAPKRRVRNLLIGGVAAVLMLGAIKYTVDLSRERTAAIAARDEAAQRRDQAEALIGFMLGDLRSKLQQAGRLELLEDVGSKAMAYFSAVPSQTLSDEELFRRSQALRQLGELRQARADLPGALETYRESLRLARDVASRDPYNADWQLGLGAAHFYVGDVLRRQRDAEGALREYAAYRDIAQRLVDREPDNETFLLELSYARNSVAAAYETQGNLEAARSELEGSLQLKQQLLQRAPENVERLQAVATDHNRLGAVLDRLGEMDLALRHLLADLEIRKRLVARDPKNRAIRRSLQVAHAFVGKAYEDRGDMPAAIAQYSAWLTVTSEQRAADPQNADWARDWARAETVMASARRLTGNGDAAEAGYLEAVKILRPLAAKSATDAARQRDLAMAEIGLGQVYCDRGDHSRALRQTDIVWQTLDPLERQGDREAIRLSAETRLLAGKALTATHRPSDAQQTLDRAAKLLAVNGVPPTDKVSLATLVRVLIAQDRPADARPLVARLRSMGYWHPTFVSETASIP